MKRLIAIAVATLALSPVAAIAAECEVDGEVGMTTAWGECMTPTLYDETFSADALAEVEVHTLPGHTVAEVYGIVDDVPSDREIGHGMGELFTFRGQLLGDLTPS